MLDLRAVSGVPAAADLRSEPAGSAPLPFCGSGARNGAKAVAAASAQQGAALLVLGRKVGPPRRLVRGQGSSLHVGSKLPNKVLCWCSFLGVFFNAMCDSLLAVEVKPLLGLNLASLFRGKGMSRSVFPALW